VISFKLYSLWSAAGLPDTSLPIDGGGLDGVKVLKIVREKDGNNKRRNL
jgi:hypothetical protein